MIASRDSSAVETVARGAARSATTREKSVADQMAALRDGTLAPQFVASFFDNATGVFDSGSQTTFALALKHAAYLAPALAAVGGGVDALVAGLVGDIAARGTTQTVGIIGVKVRARAAAAATLLPSRRSRQCANEPLRARPAMVHCAEEPRARQGAIGFRSLIVVWVTLHRADRASRARENAATTKSSSLSHRWLARHYTRKRRDD